jgi:hypothetical protein
MPADELVSSQAWLSELLETHASEIRARGLVVARDLDARFLMAPTEALEAALRDLLDFAVSTTPDHCEVYVASARATAPVARLGSGLVTMRWQVAGDRLEPGDGGVVALRPLPGDPVDHLASERVKGIARAFAQAGWRFELNAPAPAGELLARAVHG